MTGGSKGHMAREWIDGRNKTIVRDFAVTGLPKPIPPGIHGWMWSWELKWLYETARGLEDLHVDGDLLEIGSYKGLSASALAQAGNLTCIDTFWGGEDLPGQDSYPKFIDAMKIMGLCPTVLRGRSDDMLRKLLAAVPRPKFRLILVDGSHAYENVKKDLALAWPLASAGGILVADDYIGFNSVQKACDEFADSDRFHPVKPGISKMAWYAGDSEAGISALLAKIERRVQ